jgi:hypothetical protein
MSQNRPGTVAISTPTGDLYSIMDSPLLNFDTRSLKLLVTVIADITSATIDSPI